MLLERRSRAKHHTFAQLRTRRLARGVCSENSTAQLELENKDIEGRKSISFWFCLFVVVLDNRVVLTLQLLRQDFKI